jgi:predicted aminopeptidase
MVMLERDETWAGAARWALALICAIAVLGLSGCQTAEYYHQAIRGEYEILHHRRPIAELLTSDEISPRLKAQFDLVLRLRDFAAKELRLPIDKHYLTYVDLERRFAVWNVHAAPEFSLEPKKWWYPLVGSLKYRGYFLESDAREYGAELAKEGMDVYVEGVEAYSTLGWFADPLLNTFIYHPEPELTETIFHELTHQRLFLSGDTDFNEAFATAVAQAGVRRWFLATGQAKASQEYEAELERNWQFVGLVMHTRELLQALYGESDRKPRHRVQPAPAWMNDEKNRILAELRDQYATLKKSWGGYSGYDGWLNRPLNNAQLNTISVYYQLVPGFEALLAQTGGNLEAFYKKVEAMRKLSKNERHLRLLRLGKSHEKAPLN